VTQETETALKQMQRELQEADQEFHDLLAFQTSNKELTWVPDSLVVSCMSSFCSKKFNATTRKVCGGSLLFWWESPSADTFIIIIFISFFFIIILSAPLPVLWKGLLQELHEVQPFHPKIRLHQARKGLQQLQPPPQWPIFTVRRRRSCRVAFQIPEAQLLKQFRSE